MFRHVWFLVPVHENVRIYLATASTFKSVTASWVPDCKMIFELVGLGFLCELSHALFLVKIHVEIRTVVWMMSFMKVSPEVDRLQNIFASSSKQKKVRDHCSMGFYKSVL